MNSSLSNMNPHMYFKTCIMGESLVILAALRWFITSVCPWVVYKSTILSKCNHAGCIVKVFPQYMYYKLDNISLRMPKTDCIGICLFFLFAYEILKFKVKP